MNIAPLIETNTTSLAERYRLGDKTACELFGLHPSQEEHWKRRAAFLDDTGSARADRYSLAQALGVYQTKLPYYPQAEQSLRRLAEPGSLVVVGGQQAGLFGGALMIYYKALTVIQTAQYAEKLLGRPSCLSSGSQEKTTILMRRTTSTFNRPTAA
uniref:bacillithiol biosynthesis protein BshC n=1 Tax=Cohnella kolymensis TaxID=1590652 RepID=UPI000695A953|nr:bacillithiol biosynthesis BshC [Cohnella kolymensis]